MHHLIKQLLRWFAISFLLLYGLHKLRVIRQDWLDETAARVAYPLYALSNIVREGVDHWRSDHTNYETLKKEHAQLQEDYTVAVNELIALRAERHLIEETRELSEFMTRYKLDGIKAHIMHRQLDLDGQFFLVNAGANRGIANDMVAIYQNHLVGRVVEVYSWYSKVLLLTDEKSKIAAYTGKTRAPGIVQGLNQLTRCNLTYVSHLFQVLNNDLVISSGQGQVYPQGFCLGKIAFHSIKEKELYHHIQVQPIVNLKALSYVLLVDPKTIIQF